MRYWTIPADRCQRCGHAWSYHDGRDERLPGEPCCTWYAGMGEPCGCEELPPEPRNPVDPGVEVQA